MSFIAPRVANTANSRTDGVSKSKNSVARRYSEEGCGRCFDESVAISGFLGCLGKKTIREALRCQRPPRLGSGSICSRSLTTFGMTDFVYCYSEESEESFLMPTRASRFKVNHYPCSPNSQCYGTLILRKSNDDVKTYSPFTAGNPFLIQSVKPECSDYYGLGNPSRFVVLSSAGRQKNCERERSVLPSGGDRLDYNNNLRNAAQRVEELFASKCRIGQR